MEILLPVGISFYTFQTLSYTIDVYNGKKKAEKHLGIFALYVTFFPQLVAGPIERSTKLLPQFYEHHKIDFQRISSGLRLILWGCFKKVVIADYLAVFVDKIYVDPVNKNIVFVIVATYFFAFQIYCDFSGYSDIAIGSARVLGYDLMQNFNNPYFASSIKDFWKRWHISLTTWFKDYVFIPLGGSRVNMLRWFINILVVFLVSGLWHGAKWTFVAWGLLHGVLCLGSEALSKSFQSKAFNQNPKIKFIKVLVNFNLVALTWVFFRAENVKDAFGVIVKLFTISQENFIKSAKSFYFYLHDIFLTWHFSVSLACALIVILLTVDFLKDRVGFIHSDTLILKILRYIIYSIAFVMILLFYNFSDADFIYFQF